jgi:hypothetical protein
MRGAFNAYPRIRVSFTLGRKCKKSSDRFHLFANGEDCWGFLNEWTRLCPHAAVANIVLVEVEEAKLILGNKFPSSSGFV